MTNAVFLFSFIKSEIFLPAKNKLPDKRLSDEMLITRVARGETTALELLYDRYAATILGICLTIIDDQAEAEGALQETFWQIWQSASTYAARGGSFEGWLFRIARNQAIDFYRRRLSKLDNK